MAADEVTVTIDVADTTDEIRLPAGLVDLFNEAGDPEASVVADVLQVAFTQRAHAIVHHSAGGTDPEHEAFEEHARDLFEQRFGETFEEATGHSH